MHEIIHKIKRWAGMPEMVTVAIIVIVGLASFGLGRLSALESKREPVRIVGATASAPLSDIRMSAEGYQDTVQEAASVQNPASGFESGGQVVGSKNGTKYHFPWCSGAQRIKEENKRWFDTVAAARAAGYSPAANCKGLE